MSYVRVVDDCFRFHYQLLHVAYLRFSDYSEYRNVVSPYYRLYYIEEGNGDFILGSKTFHMEAGTLYLIPAFENCSYYFQKDLSHLFIHFVVSFENGMPPGSLIVFKNKMKATALSRMLLYRLLEINPGLELPHHDPKVYQSKPWMNKKNVYHSPAQKIESDAIIQLLFSGFIDSTSHVDMNTNLKYNIREVLAYIHSNLQNDIRVEQLAQVACLSKDHFTRIFKSIFGVSPLGYIIQKRIERSQFLLLTTDLPISRIVEETNFKTPPYFNRMFKKCIGCTPAVYRNQKG